MTKEVLTQYCDLQEEIEEVRNKINRIENEIPKIQKRIDEIEAGELVRDKVRGGAGGIQNFNIEGVPVKEYQKRKTDLLSKKLLLNNRKSTLELLEFRLLQKTNEVEEFIASLDDSRMRRIINFRFLENKSWLQTAYALGGNATADSVRMEFDRFFKKM